MTDSPDHWHDVRACCAHKYEPRIRIIKGGQKQCLNQCLICGYADASFPVKLCHASTTPFDATAYQACREWADGMVRAARLTRKRERRAQYNHYLNSQAWEAMRQIILARAFGVCEICGTNKAAHVHHLTYERFGAERPEDLMAVCIPCHEQIHGERK